MHNTQRLLGRVRDLGGLEMAGKVCTCALVLACLVAGGCGYSTRRPYPQNIRTVYVEMFQSREFRRGLEFTLTEALQKRILQDTPYRIADKNTADTMISGEILEVHQTVLGRTLGTGQPRQLQANFIIRFQWKDLRSGQMLVDRPRFSETVTYVPPVDMTFDNGADLALEGLAERLVEQMMSSW